MGGGGGGGGGGANSGELFQIGNRVGFIIHIISFAVFRWGGGGGSNRGSLPRAPSVRGPPNSGELFQIRSGSSFTSLVSLSC